MMADGEPTSTGIADVIQEFVSQQKDLLELELRSEQGEETEAYASTTTSSSSNTKSEGKEQAVEERPQNVLRGLEVESVTVGLYGRTVVHLCSAAGRGQKRSVAGQQHPQRQRQQQKKNENEADEDGEEGGQVAATSSSSGEQQPLLPAHRLTVGDEVEILGKSDTSSHGSSGNSGGGRSNKNVTGVICSLNETTISIALFGGGRRGGSSSRSGTSSNDSKKKSSTVNSTSNSTNGRGEDNDDGSDEYGIGQPPLTILPRSSASVHRKMMDALDELKKSGADHKIAGQIIKAVFCPNVDDGDGGDGGGSCSGFDGFQRCNTSNLDEHQQEAVNFALGATGSRSDSGRPLALIHGPPGTGKTTTVVDLIKRAVYEKGWRVLVTAPSNVAVDNVLEKLVAPERDDKTSLSRGARKKRYATPQRKIKAVRLGHPARIKQSTQPYSLESLVHCADATEVVNEVRKELNSYLNVLANQKSRYSDRRVARSEVKVLRSELRQREGAVVSNIIVSADVVLATNVGAASSALDKCLAGERKAGFDLVVIDESAQALEASCWIPILRGHRLVLAGDHKQLPPTIKCNDRRVQRGLGRTLFERVMELYGDEKLTGQCEVRGQVSRMLRTQYRMNENIADWASEATYDGKLINHKTVRSHELSDLSHVTLPSNDFDQCDATEFSPLLLVDTVGCDMHESVNSAGSRYNEGEARIVAWHVQSLLKVGVDPREIAVISPYNGQVELLRSVLLPGVPSLEIRSVDGFQGGEREAVILSLVRSSERAGASGGIGFLKDRRRLNVAVTRARRHCCVICDSETVSRSDFIRGLVSWIEDRGDYRSAAEFAPSDEIVAGRSSAGSTQSRNPPPTNKSEQRTVDIKTSVKERAVPPTLERSQTKYGKKAAVNKADLEGKRRKMLMDKIGSFSEKAKGGDEMSIGTNMSKFDELVAVELARQLGLEHRSEGSGINRRTVVRKVGVTDLGNVSEPKEAQNVESAFVALTLESSDSESNISDDEEVVATSSGGGKNILLTELAKERMQRQKHQKQPKETSRSASKAGNKKVKGTKKGKKKHAGKARAQVDVSASAERNERGDLDDDMAFLDSEIERVQTSHGRKVEGGGKAYKSIINGVLLSKPEPRERKRDDRASHALKEKLKKAGDDRKVKAKGGKKKK